MLDRSIEPYLTIPNETYVHPRLAWRFAAMTSEAGPRGCHTVRIDGDRRLRHLPLDLGITRNDTLHFNSPASLSTDCHIDPCMVVGPILDRQLLKLTVTRYERAIDAQTLYAVITGKTASLHGGTAVTHSCVHKHV